MGIKVCGSRVRRGSCPAYPLKVESLWTALVTLTLSDVGRDVSFSPYLPGAPPSLDHRRLAYAAVTTEPGDRLHLRQGPTLGYIGLKHLFLGSSWSLPALKQQWTSTFTLSTDDL